MNYPIGAAAVLGVLIGITGCYHQDDNNLLELPPVGAIRVVHALGDGPVLRFSSDLAVIATLAFAESSPAVITDLGDIGVDVTFTDPATLLMTPLLSDVPVTLTEDRLVTLIVHGSFAVPQIMIIDTMVNDLDATADEIELRYANATQDSVDVYLTDADELLAMVSPSQTLAGGAFSDSIVATASDNFRLRVTRENDATVVYDSGPFIILAGALRDFTVVESFGPRADALGVIIASEVSTLVFLNQVDTAEIRSLNAVADEDSIDVDITDQATAANIASDTVPFGDLSAFTEFTPVDVTASHSVASDPGNVAFQLDLESAPTVFYTFVAAGSQGNQTLTGDFVASADMRPIETVARVHFVHASESAGSVDVFYLDPGESPVDGQPAVAGVGLFDDFRSSVFEGAIDVYVTNAGTTAELVGPVQVNLASRDLLLFHITDSVGGGAPIQFNVSVEPAP